MPPRIVDADAHVIETPQTFSYIEPQHERFRPILMKPVDATDRIDTQGGNLRTKEYWLVDNQVWTGTRNQGYQETTAGQREMTDIEGRLAHMDRMGIDIQVLYPTFFLTVKTENPEWEWPLIRSYNRWLADVWTRGDNRLRWVAIPPLRSMEKVRDELAFCRDNGACGIFLVGLECNRELDDPYFYPLWEAAQELDLAACIHSGNHSAAFMNLYKNSGSRFMTNRSTGVAAFHSLIMRDIPERFPGMRWGFVEFSASWLPYAINYTALSYWKNRNDPDWDSRDLLKRNRIYVACQVSDDLPYIIDKAGEDNLVIGTDYGHHDQATEIDAMRKLQSEGALPAHVVERYWTPTAAPFMALTETGGPAARGTWN